MWIRFANSHTGQRHYDRANRPDRWQHPTTAKTRIYSCIFWGVHRWKALDDDVFVRRIKDWEKTIRKRNGIVGFATQSAQDALESRISSAIIEQAATQIFMVNPKARAEDYINGFGLSRHEFELVRNLPDNSHCFLIRHGRESVVARLNLTGEQDLLTILSGREATVRLFDDLVETTGPDPERWMQLLIEKAA